MNKQIEQQKIISALKQILPIKVERLSSRELFFLCKYYWNTNRRALQACKNVAQKRLESKGNQWCQGIGWIKTKDIPNMGIALKYGKWFIEDRRKYNAYNTPEDINAKYVAEYNNKLI